MKRSLFLTLSIVTLCWVATPAMADMIPLNFSYHWLDTSFDTTTDVLTMSLHAGGEGSVTNGSVANGLSLFSLTMTIDNETTGHGTGTFTLTDTDGDTIAGNVSGTWADGGSAIGLLLAPLSNVNFVQTGPADGQFNGTGGFVAIAANGWKGTGSLMLGPIATDNWFDSSWSVSDAGSADGHVSAVPIPAAALLGLLGLSAAGVGLRKIS